MIKRIAVIIADDHPLMVSGVEARLDGEPDVVVVGTATRADELVDMVRALEPDVIVADLALAGGTLLGVLPAILGVAPRLRVLVLSASDEPDVVVSAIEAGVAGFISKETDSSLLAGHIRSVMAGETVLDARASAALAARLRVRATGGGLTPRELEVLRLVGRGLNNRQIAAELFLSVSTVKTHLDRMFEKLDVHDRATAVAVARAAGLLG